MNKRIALGIFLICFVVRLAYGWQSLITPEAVLSSDGRGYLELAGELAHGRFPSLFRTPGYPLFLMMTGGLPGTSPLTSLLSQMILDSLTAVILASIAWRLWGNQTVSLLAGLLYAISPVAVTLSGMIMSETLSVFLIVAAFRLALSTPSWINTTIQALCWVGTTLSRPFSILLPLIICAFLLLWFHRTGDDWSRRWKSQTAVLAFYVICLAAWTGWNYHRSGMVMFSANPDVSFYIYEIPAVRIVDQLSRTGYLRMALLRPKEFDRLGEEHQKAYARELYPDANPVPQDLWFTKDDPASIRRIRADAALRTRGRLADLLVIHLTGALITIRPKWASADLPTKLLEILRLLLIPMAVTALIWKRRWWLLALFGVWMLYVALPPGPCAFWRFRTLAEPIISLAAAFALMIICGQQDSESGRDAEARAVVKTEEKRGWRRWKLFGE